MNPRVVIEWKLAAFDALSVRELHDVLQLRSEVFVVEQNCVFQDIDGADDQAMHVLGTQNNQLVAYARCFPAGVKFAEASIGRVGAQAQLKNYYSGHGFVDMGVPYIEDGIDHLEMVWTPVT